MSNKTKNWLGLDAHPTDNYVHWTERDPEKLMLELRERYDKIVSAGLEKELKFLLDSAWNSANLDANDGLSEGY